MQYPSFGDRIFNLWIFFAHAERQLTPDMAYVSAVMTYVFLQGASLFEGQSYLRRRFQDPGTL